MEIGGGTSQRLTRELAEGGRSEEKSQVKEMACSAEGTVRGEQASGGEERSRSARKAEGERASAHASERDKQVPLGQTSVGFCCPKYEPG